MYNHNKPRVLIWNAPGTCDQSRKALTKMFEETFHLEVYESDFIHVDYAKLPKGSIFAVGGGNAAKIINEIEGQDSSSDVWNTVRRQVMENGMFYFGLCAGAILATRECFQLYRQNDSYHASILHLATEGLGFNLSNMSSVAMFTDKNHSDTDLMDRKPEYSYVTPLYFPTSGSSLFSLSIQSPAFLAQDNKTYQNIAERVVATYDYTLSFKRPYNNRTTSALTMCREYKNLAAIVVAERAILVGPHVEASMVNGETRTLFQNGYTGANEEVQVSKLPGIEFHQFDNSKNLLTREMSKLIRDTYRL